MGFFDAIGKGLGAIGKGLGSLFGGTGELGLSGPTGQAAKGMAGSTLPSLSQFTSNIPTIPGLDKINLPAGLADAPSLFSTGTPFASLPGLEKISLPAGMMDIGAGVADVGGKLDLGRLLKYGAAALPVVSGLLKSNAPPPGSGPVNAAAANANEMAKAAWERSQLLNRGADAAMQGQLPGPAKTALDQALRSSQTAIKSNYATMGTSGSSMERQDLADAERRAYAMQFQIGQQMANTGLNAALNAANLAGNFNNQAGVFYKNIMDAETQQGTDFGDALAKFSSLIISPSEQPQKRVAA